MNLYILIHFLRLHYHCSALIKEQYRGFQDGCRAVGSCTYLLPASNWIYSYITEQPTWKTYWSRADLKHYNPGVQKKSHVGSGKKDKEPPHAGAAKWEGYLPLQNSLPKGAEPSRDSQLRATKMGRGAKYHLVVRISGDSVRWEADHSTPGKEHSNCCSTSLESLLWTLGEAMVLFLGPVVRSAGYIQQ